MVELLWSFPLLESVKWKPNRKSLNRNFIISHFDTFANSLKALFAEWLRQEAIRF